MPRTNDPWTATIELTFQAENAGNAEEEAKGMLEYLVSAWDGLTGAVMKVELNMEVDDDGSWYQDRQKGEDG